MEFLSGGCNWFFDLVVVKLPFYKVQTYNQDHLQVSINSRDAF